MTGPRANECVDALHLHVGICQRAGYANGLKDAEAAVEAACDLAEAEGRHVVDDEVYVSVGLIRNAVGAL